MPISSLIISCPWRVAQVLGLEKFSIAHEMGSSHGLSRIIRLAYHEDPRCASRGCQYFCNGAAQ